MEKKEILLTFLSLPIEKKQEIISPIQIMKSMFLLKEKLKIKDFYDFIPYLYGPCSFEVYSDLISLKEENLIEDVQSSFSWKYYKITSKGLEIANNTLKLIDKTILTELKEIKKLVLGMNFIELLKYIYEKYPEYTKNTVVDLEALK